MATTYLLQLWETLQKSSSSSLDLVFRINFLLGWFFLLHCWTPPKWLSFSDMAARDFCRCWYCWLLMSVLSRIIAPLAPNWSSLIAFPRHCYGIKLEIFGATIWILKFHSFNYILHVTALSRVPIKSHLIRKWLQFVQKIQIIMSWANRFSDWSQSGMRYNFHGPWVVFVGSLGCVSWNAINGPDSV